MRSRGGVRKFGPCNWKPAKPLILCSTDLGVEQMAGMGPPPKPAYLRQRANRKPGSATISAPSAPEVPPIPNPDGRVWHPLTLEAWQHAWESPMATQWLVTDVDALGRLA